MAIISEYHPISGSTIGISVDEVQLRKDERQVKPWETYKKIEIVPLTALLKSFQVDDDTDLIRAWVIDEPKG